MSTSDYERELIDTARPYWAAESEIPRRFVAKKPKRDEYVSYLRSAVYKELNPAIGYAPPELQQLYDDVKGAFEYVVSELEAGAPTKTPS